MEDADKKLIQEMIDQSLTKAMDFSTRKRGDTPTDDSQLVPKEYCDTNTIAVSSLFGAKGDLLAGQASSLFGRLPVGANGLYLMADSGQSMGLQYASVTALRTITASNLSASVTSSTSYALSTLYPFYAQESGTFQSTEGTSFLDFTYTTLGFDPRMIFMYGSMSSSSITRGYYNAYLTGGTEQAQAPCVWINDAIKVGYYRNDNAAPDTFEDTTQDLIQYQTPASAVFSINVQSHSSASTVIRLAREVGTGDIDINYKFNFIAFP